MPEPPKSGRPVANEILGYLIRNPEANDTVTGIVEWWLLDQRIERSVAEVKDVLEELLTNGLILCEPGPDGQARYRVNESKRAQILERLKANSEKTAGTGRTGQQAE